jgi:glycosyltransferase involved in cell wall biosynthesis
MFPAPSILMPIYNGVEFIHESINSVLQQTIKNWELLIAVNGYPKDSTIYIKVRDFVASLKDERIKVFDYYDCKGKAATLNKMLTECENDYVALLDVDDIWLPDKLAIQQPFLLQNYDVIGSKCVYFGEMNNIFPNIPIGDISHFNFLLSNPVINSSSIIRKTLAQWDINSFIEDYDLWLRLWRQNKHFYNCPEVLVKHRIHKESAFNAKGNHNHVAALQQKYL